MKVLCGDSVLDLDAINNYKPDGETVYCQFDIATYKTENMPEKEFGTFIKTDDHGVIYFTDIVFKMLFDLCVRAKIDNVKYLVREMNRGIAGMEDADASLTRPNQKKPFGLKLGLSKVKNVLMLNTDCIVSHNLKILSEYDMINMMCADYDHYSQEYKDACLEFVAFLSEDIYLGRDIKSFTYLHTALTDLFTTFSSTEFKNFVEKFYEMLDKIPKIKYTEKTAGTLGSKPAEEEPITSADADEATQKEVHVKETSTHDEKTNKSTLMRKLKTVSGADITGLDETYALGYCEELYDKEIENADSDGFLEKMIISRVNSKAAPIDLLSEAITREHEKDTPANWLRNNMSNMRENLEEIVEQAGE